MIESHSPVTCSNCHEQMTAHTKIVRDDEGGWMHADGCGLDLGVFLGLATKYVEPKIPGAYKGKKTTVCLACFLTTCDCGPGSQ